MNDFDRAERRYEQAQDAMYEARYAEQEQRDGIIEDYLNDLTASQALELLLERVSFSESLTSLVERAVERYERKV